MKKKLVSIIAISAMVASMAACGSTSSNSSAPAAEPSAPAETATTEGEVYTIGVCQLVQHPALDAATEGFQAKLTELLGEGNVEFDVQNASGDSATCSTIANQFASNADMDLIMANATPALQAAHSATDSIPILGTSVTDYATALEIDDWTGTTGLNISGTADLAPLSEQAAMLNELFPDAKTVGILYCSAEPNSGYQARVITEALTGMGYTVTDYTFADSNDVASATTNASQNCDVIYIPTDNTAASNTEVINNICEPAGVPIVAGEEGICKGCGIATLSISYYELGEATGQMAYEILVNGADPATMEVQTAANVTKEYMADRAALLNVTIPDGYEAIAVEE